MTIRTVGVVGVGLMGAGIAEVCARAGYQVIVREVSEDLLSGGLARIRQSLDKAIARGKLSQSDAEAALARLQATTELSALAETDLILEAITEKLEVKAQLFTQLDRLCAPRTILATNTSCLSVTALAAATQRADRVLGIHFFNPAPVMPLVELVRALDTSEETLQTAREFAQALGKTVVLAPDAPGFIVNRLLIPYLLDAIRLLQDGVASREDIDSAIKLGLNYPMGPLALADFIGLDTCLYIAEAMYEEFKESRFAAPPLLRRLVRAGRLGRKSSKGFYEY
jgi:3-hydroxybutyryl-CoA dehydrogenase